MSRGHQSRRRRSYGRRQHEVRERNGGRPVHGWLPEEIESDGALRVPSRNDEPADGQHGPAQP